MSTPTQTWEVGQVVEFWYTRSDGERTLRRGTVHRVYEWGVCIYDHERQEYRSFRWDRMG